MHLVRFRIQKTAASPSQLSQLRHWFEREWGTVDPFDAVVEGKPTPGPILALDSEQLLIAGLAFASAKHPVLEVQALWINALYVVEPHRRRGVASRLILEAEGRARSRGFSTLHAFTDIPELYCGLRWKVISTEGKHSVVYRNL
ncbi:MAG: GNAT family N-acetyltransferase [Burkholderiales bacterium PBB3]|nr:MAG: GNAT family N-acetyltransferase [Burkholderiales bacterium PBB3]